MPSGPDGPGFQCDITHVEERAVLSVRGDVDLNTAPVLQRDAFAALAPPVGGLVVDLGSCTFMDSSGISALLRIHNKARELGIQFTLTSVPRTVRTVLDITGLTEELGLTGGPQPSR